MNIDDIIAIGMLLATLVTIILTQCSAKKQNKHLLKQNELMLKQNRFALFAEYTRRYQDLILRMPETICLGEFKHTDMEAVKYMRLYFDLCSEEYWLHQEELIPEKTWEIWMEGMQTTLNQKPFKDAWNYLSGYYDEEFARFFRTEVVERKKQV